jgi:hypothetical protein
MDYVFLEVRTEYLHIIMTSFGLKGLRKYKFVSKVHVRKPEAQLSSLIVCKNNGVD